MTTEDEEIEDDDDEEFSSSSSCFDRQSERFSVVSETKLVVLFQRSSRANRTYNQLKVRRVQQNGSDVSPEQLRQQLVGELTHFVVR